MFGQSTSYSTHTTINMECQIISPLLSCTDATTDEDLDLVFLLDRSGSVGSQNHRLSTNFIKNTTGLLDIGLNKTRVGLIAYSHRVVLEFDLDDYSNLEELEGAIDSVEFTGGGTKTGAALQRSRTLLNSSSNEGARSGVPHVLVLLTGMILDIQSIIIHDPLYIRRWKINN